MPHIFDLITFFWWEQPHRCNINTFHHTPIVATVLLDSWLQYKKDYCEFNITSSDRFLDLWKSKADLYSWRFYHSVWSSSCRLECSWAVSVQTGGSELHDKLQNGRLCTAAMPDICHAHKIICRNFHINKLCCNTSNGKYNVMAVFEERSYSKVLAVWLP